MSLADPLAVASFADLLNAADIEFNLEWQQQLSNAGGELLTADRAPAMRRAKITTAPMPNATAEGLLALANSRGGGMKTFLLYNKRLPYPSSDPTGSIMGATTPALGTITDRLHVAFTGFPAGYVIPLGTYFGLIFDTSRYYLGQFAEAKTATGGGAVTAVEISPALPASVSGTPAVTVLKPPAKFKLEPNSAYLTNVGIVNASLVLSARQTYAQ